MLWHRYVKNLLDSLKVEDAISNSRKNFLVEGLDYLCLLNSSEQVVKIYDISSSIQTVNKRHKLLLHPQTNAYNSHIILLQGKVQSVTLGFFPKTIQPEEPVTTSEIFNLHNKFTIDTELRDPVSYRGPKSFVAIGDLLLNVVENLSEVGDSTYVDNNAIHSIRPVSERRVTLLVIQHKDLDKTPLEIYRQDSGINTKDTKINQLFTKDEIHGFINRIDNLCSEIELSLHQIKA